MSIQAIGVLFVIAAIANSSGAGPAGGSEMGVADELVGQTSPLTGLCVLIGGSEELTERLAAHPRLLLHRLDDDADIVNRLRERFRGSRQGATVMADYWTRPILPHSDNSVNLLIASNPEAVSHDEITRVLVPGGVAFLGTGAQMTRIEKPWPQEMGQWTHQWSSAGGNLVSEDRMVGIPQGLRWLAGPLFAMAGRKTSTQSLVSAGGYNFYVTQNVLENIGRSEMDQYLVARDAFNGLIRWTRRWEGPFVRGDGETNPRLVASSDTLYIVNSEGLLAINARTGETRKSVALEHLPDKLLLAGGLILAQSPHGVLAYNEQLSKRQWEFRDHTVHGTVVCAARALLLVSGLEEEGDFQHELVCLDLSTGRPLWRTDMRPHVTSRQLRINFAQDDWVAVMAHGSLHMLAIDTGQHLWSVTTEARPGKTYVDERYVGHFYQHGLVWLLAENSPRTSDGQNVWRGLDPRTGQERRVLRTQGDWPSMKPGKMGCSLLLALDRYIVVPRLSTFIDFDTGQKHTFSFVRGGCGLGFVPANGLVYSHPHACGCFSEVIRGFVAVHSSQEPSVATTPERLETGPANGRQNVAHPQPDDWPMHRYGVERGASCPAELEPSLKPLWSTEIAPLGDTPAEREWTLRAGAPLTAATIVGDRVFVADVNRGRVVALARDTGREQWAFPAGSRVDTPPTIAHGLCLFGAHDGYVYALDAGDGQLVWRFRAAPVERRITAFGSLESPWPVAGSVLVQHDTVFAAAGRAAGADGGMHIHALELANGTPRWSVRLADERFYGVCDYLVGDGEKVFLSNWQFSADGEHQPAAFDSSHHLQGGQVGLREASWTKYDLASRKAIQTWAVRRASGQLLAFSPEAVASYQTDIEEVRDDRILAFEGETSWAVTVPAPAQITALALTARHVVAAGAKDRSNDAAGGILWLLDRQDGRVCQALSLPAAAAFDTVAVAHSRVFVSTADGRLLCLGP